MDVEREFSKKPRRMAKPSWVNSEWLVGYDGVEVVMETDPARMAYFAREATWGDLMREPSHDELADTLAEIARGGVLGAAYKGGVGFRIKASRSTMDQMLRLAEGRGGAGSGAAAQTTRDTDLRDFNIVIPNTIESLRHSIGPNTAQEQRENNLLWHRVEVLLEDMREVYGALIDSGVPPQDARYVALPLGFQTQWFHIMSAGNLIKLCEQRLCNGLMQHETDYLVRVMRDLVVMEQPWLDQQLRSDCEKRGQCVSRSMLFPPCGAFVKDHSTAGEPPMDLNEVRLRVSQYDPDRHLYPAEKNDAMRFVEWDVERNRLESLHPDVIYSMAGPPVALRSRERN